MWRSPAAPQRAHEAHGRLVLRGANLQCLAAVVQLAPLRIEELELAYEPVAIAHVRKSRGASGRIDRPALRLRLVGEDAKLRELVLDVAKRHQHLLAIVRDRLIELVGGVLHARGAPSAVEDGQGEDRADAPRSSGPFEEIAQLGRCVADARREREIREPRRLRKAHSLLRSEHRELRRGHIRTSRKHG